MVPPGDTPHLSKISDLNMLAMMGGKERTDTESRALLTSAGFTGIEYTPDRHTIFSHPGNSAITTPPAQIRAIGRLSQSRHQ